MTVRIPTRFEQLVGDPTPLIIGVEADLEAFERLRRSAQTQQAGVLGLLVAGSGTGKTTSVYSTSALLADRYQAVTAVPRTIAMSEIPRWIDDNVPRADRSTPVLIDHREKIDDEVAIGQMMSGLNGLLRERPDLMVLWPTTDDTWRDQLLSEARRVGGRTLLPTAGEMRIQGPARDQWPKILERLLIQLDQSREDLALDESTIHEVADRARDAGEFLELIRDIIVEQVDEVRLSRALPQLLFIVTSDSAVVGEANRLRRAGTLNLKSEELVSYSRKSGAGKYWLARKSNPSHHLAYMLSLFQARLVTMTASSVAYAALQYGDEDLVGRVQAAGLKRSTTNARTTFMSSDLYRLLTGSTSLELTSTTKGKTAQTTIDAYKAVQAASAKRHKAINMSICALAENVVPEFKASEGSFEVDLGDANSFADAVIALDGEALHLEFHHLSPAHCKASSIAAYVMEKVQTYAVNYNLIPR